MQARLHYASCVITPELRENSLGWSLPRLVGNQRQSILSLSIQSCGVQSWQQAAKDNQSRALAASWCRSCSMMLPMARAARCLRIWHNLEDVDIRIRLGYSSISPTNAGLVGARSIRALTVSSQQTAAKDFIFQHLAAARSCKGVRFRGSVRCCVAECPCPGLRKSRGCRQAQKSCPEISNSNCFPRQSFSSVTHWE